MVVTLYLCFDCWQLFFSKTLERKVSNGIQEYHKSLTSNVICYKVAQRFLNDPGSDLRGKSVSYVRLLSSLQSVKHVF